jgi:hypothetical protein
LQQGYSVKQNVLGLMGVTKFKALSVSMDVQV